MERFCLPADWDHLDVLFDSSPVSLGSEEVKLDVDDWMNGIVDNLHSGVGSPLPISPLSPSRVPTYAGGLPGDDRTEYGLSNLNMIQDTTNQDQVRLGTTSLEAWDPFPSPVTTSFPFSPTTHFALSPEPNVKTEAPSPAPAVIPNFSPDTTLPFTSSPQPSPTQTTCAEWLESLLSDTPTDLVLVKPDSTTLPEILNCDVSNSLLEVNLTLPKTENTTSVLIPDEELVYIQTKALNLRLKNATEEEKKWYKHRRRTLKNRNYAHHCRTKKQVQQTEIEKENQELKERNTYLEKQCDAYQRQFQLLKANLQYSLQNNVLIKEIAKLRQMLKVTGNSSKMTV